MVFVSTSSLDVFSLPTLSITDRCRLPDSSGVYFVISEGVVQYIGMSGNIRERWLTHHLWRKFLAMPEAFVAWLLIEDVALLRSVETELIAWYEPPINVETRRKYRKETPNAPMKVAFHFPGLGDRIRTARKLDKRPLTELCDFVGIDRQTWYGIENETLQSVDISTIRTIEFLLGVNFGIRS